MTATKDLPGNGDVGKQASAPAVQLTAEMLWALLLFPSNMKARTKRQQIRDIWTMSGGQLDEKQALLDDTVLIGIGSGGPGFNNYRPSELEFLISLVRDLKQKNESERRNILTDYDKFLAWIDSVPRKGSRQFRHMLRYFAFPDRVERISSNNDRRKILKGFGIGSVREVADWKDRQLHDKLMELSTRLQAEQPTSAVDFYQSPWREQWIRERKVKTVEGEVTVTVPGADAEVDDKEHSSHETKIPDTRESIQIQAKLARIGAVMGFRVWIPRGDRHRVLELLGAREQPAFLDDLPLNYDDTTLDTIELIDVLWLKGRSIVRLIRCGTH